MNKIKKLGIFLEISVSKFENGIIEKRDILKLASWLIVPIYVITYLLISLLEMYGVVDTLLNFLFLVAIFPFLTTLYIFIIERPSEKSKIIKHLIILILGTLAIYLFTSELYKLPIVNQPITALLVIYIAYKISQFTFFIANKLINSIKDKQLFRANMQLINKFLLAFITLISAILGTLLTIKKILN